MRKIGEYLGLLEDTGRYDDEYDDDDEYDAALTPATTPPPAPRSRLSCPRAAAACVRPTSRTSASGAARPRPNMPSCPGSPRCTRAPTTRRASIGENFREGTPVIMNLSEMDDADAKRLVDFAAGLVFATRGTIERITSKVFLLSPPNVSVAAEDKARLVETGGFFNQS